MNRAARAVRLAVVVLALAGCGGGQGLAPVQERPTALDNARKQHVVRRGESLYIIAWRHGLDYRRLARANNIRPPYRIVPGQRLVLREAPVQVVRRAPRVRPRPPAPPPASSPPASSPTGPATRPARPATAPLKPADSDEAPDAGGAAQGAVGGARFIWPTKGKVASKFGAGGNTGIDIAGRLGQPVNAVAGGEVVYVGSGLLGYGKLIIIKHEDNYLTAYAHNDSVLVGEGERIRQGQQVATLGQSGTDSPKLHFELRRGGDILDPEKYLGR